MQVFDRCALRRHLTNTLMFCFVLQHQLLFALSTDALPSTTDCSSVHMSTLVSANARWPAPTSAQYSSRASVWVAVTIGNCVWPLLPRPGKSVQLTPLQVR